MQEDFSQEQKVKNLEEAEKNPEKIEPEETRDPSQRINEIDSDISKRQENITKTEKDLDAVRSALSLPVMPEMPPSIVASQAQIERLNKEKSELEGNGEEPAQESKVDKQKEMEGMESDLENVLRQIEAQAKLMLGALYERQQQQFTPLQSGQEFQQMASLIKDISRMEGKNLDENKFKIISDAVDNLTGLVDRISVRQGGGQIRDNSDNLGKLMQGVKQFKESSSTNGQILKSRKLEDPNLEGAKNRLGESFHRLSEKSDKVINLAGGMRETLLRYNSR